MQRLGLFKLKKKNKRKKRKRKRKTLWYLSEIYNIFEGRFTSVNKLKKNFKMHMNVL